MRLKNHLAFLFLLLGGCSVAEFTEPPLSPPSRFEKWEDEGEAVAPASAKARRRDNPPVALLRSPEVGAWYRAGTVITFEGRGTDSEDGALPASAFTWRVDIHQGERVVSFVPPISGMALGTFTVPAEAEPGASGWYRIHLRVRDSDGNTHAVFRDVHPQEGSPSARRSASLR